MQVVVAGSMDSFQIFVWAVKTARLLDVLAAHEGPVVALAFSPTQPLLASASWDGTVRTWDIFRCATRLAYAKRLSNAFRLDLAMPSFMEFKGVDMLCQPAQPSRGFSILSARTQARFDRHMS